MKSFALVAAFAGFAFAAPQAVTSAIAPQGSAPAGCVSDAAGTFELYVVKAGNQKRSTSTALEINLKGGVLTDAKGRTGYIASNNQFQFDGPVQAGAIYTAGWSVCGNKSLALGSSTTFYECLSGTFYNLYDDNEAAQCSPIQLEALTSGSVTGAASVNPDGQITAGTAHTVLCQITDGQIQQNTCVTTATVIAEQSDGQITGAPVTQITDGQIQAPTSTPANLAPVTTTATPISQASDGQPIAPTNGTIIVSTPTLTAGPTSAATSPSQATTNAAVLPAMRAELVGLAAAVLALAAL